MPGSDRSMQTRSGRLLVSCSSRFSPQSYTITVQPERDRMRLMSAVLVGSSSTTATVRGPELDIAFTASPDFLLVEQHEQQVARLDGGSCVDVNLANLAVTRA